MKVELDPKVHMEKNAKLSKISKEQPTSLTILHTAAVQSYLCGHSLNTQQWDRNEAMKMSQIPTEI